MTCVKTWPLLLLLFSLLSVVKADCNFPVLNGKFIMSAESIRMNNFPEGSKAFVECPKGQEPKEGSNSILCTNGNWSDVELICKKIDCGPPEDSLHMKYSIPNGTLFGAFIQPKCERGYDLEGSSFRQCLVSGWSGSSECTLITCDEPAPIDHGKFIMPRKIPEFGDVIKYSCDENYTLSGNGSITCGENWKYNSPPPECKVIITQTTASTTTNKTTTTATATVTDATVTDATVTDTTVTDTTVTAITTATVTDTTHSHGRHEEQPTFTEGITELLSSGPAIAMYVIVGGVIIFFVLYHNYKQRGSYNTGEDKRTKEELLLNQSL